MTRLFKKTYQRYDSCRTDQYIVGFKCKRRFMSGLLDGIRIYYIPAEDGLSPEGFPDPLERYRQYGAVIIPRTSFDGVLNPDDANEQIARVDAFLEHAVQDMEPADILVVDRAIEEKLTAQQLIRRGLEIAAAERLAERQASEGNVRRIAALALIRADRRDAVSEYFVFNIPRAQTRDPYRTVTDVLHSARGITNLVGAVRLPIAKIV